MHLAGVLDAIHNSHKTVQNAFVGTQGGSTVGTGFNHIGRHEFQWDVLRSSL